MLIYSNTNDLSNWTINSLTRKRNLSSDSTSEVETSVKRVKKQLTKENRIFLTSNGFKIQNKSKWLTS